MCPDKEILSAYLDGEVPHPWDEKIGQHAAACPGCSSRLNELRGVSRLLRESGSLADGQVAESMARVYQRISHEHGFSGTKSRFWKRQIAIPVPLLAAAAALVLFLGIGLVAGGGSGEPAAVAEASQPDIYSVKLSDGGLDNLAEILRNRDEKVQVFIELPPASKFDPGNEPQLIRAADFHRQ